MSNFDHKKIIERLNALDKMPTTQEKLLTWVKAKAHIDFLRENTLSQEIVIYAASEYSYIYSMAVPEKLIDPLDKDDLMAWNINPFISASSYVWGGGRDDVWVEHNASGAGSTILDKGTHLVYGRTFEGWSGADRSYFELSQEYAHLEGLHWRPEQCAYCRFDECGDLTPIVSITARNSDTNISLVTFNRDSIEAYLAASKQVLIRVFDFTLLDSSNFSGWNNGEEKNFNNLDDIFYKQKICGPAAYTRGVQIIKPSRPKSEIFSSMRGVGFESKEKKHFDFVAYDWRNSRISKISTRAEATTNYFQAEHNNLPFELSPAFFKPEVILKYKTDKDKYTVGERKIHCRAAWSLEAFDVNEAGQIFVYICDLRRLPESELLHWLSYNEKPKASISERARINDFEGRFVNFVDPLEKIKMIIRTWDSKKYTWWKLKDDQLIDNVTVPLTASRDEWGDSFLTLTQLINEGFVVKAIRKQLKIDKIDFDKQDGSLALLNKLINFKKVPENDFRLNGLSTAQFIRTKVKGHSNKDEAEQLALKAIKEHGTYAMHFRQICEKIYEELQIIQNQFVSNEND